MSSRRTDHINSEERDDWTYAAGGEMATDSGWKEALIHLAGGAIGGTAGVAFTCPFEVVKTRLQSSHGHEIRLQLEKERLLRQHRIGPSSSSTPSSAGASRWVSHWLNSRQSVRCFQTVWKEGRFRALYKGLRPNLIGVVPSKAIYFCGYSTIKRCMNNPDRWWYKQTLVPIVPNSAFVHMSSALLAAMIAAFCVNPIWMVKTRLQLYSGQMGAIECTKIIYNREGFRAFWKGYTGSCLGTAETAIQFVLYEKFRAFIQHPETFIGKEDGQNFWQFAMAGAGAKLIAVSVCYPHEVFRTRLREEGSSGKWGKIFRDVYGKDGFWRGVSRFWRGFTVQLIRSIPNTAITLGVYEAVVYFAHQFLHTENEKRTSEITVQQTEWREKVVDVDEQKTDREEVGDGRSKQRISRC